MAKFADLERETDAANARADAAEEQAAAAFAQRDEAMALATARVKDASAREREAGRLIALATDATQRAARLERMLRQSLWRETYLALLPAYARLQAFPEHAVAKAAEAAHAAALLEPPAPRIDETDEPREAPPVDVPYVCPGCHAVGESCAPGCIDASIEAAHRQAIEQGDYDASEDDV